MLLLYGLLLIKSGLRDILTLRLRKKDLKKENLYSERFFLTPGKLMLEHLDLIGNVRM